VEQFIRYLYEYQQGKPSRNVGFVKSERDEEQTTVHIHGKGLQLGRETELKLYIFFVEEGAPVGIFQGMITNINPAVNYRLTFGVEDTGAPGNYPKIQGIIMESEEKRRFAAVWSDFPVDMERMREWEEPEIIPLTMTEAVRQKAAADSAGGREESAADGEPDEVIDGAAEGTEEEDRGGAAAVHPEQERGTEKEQRVSTEAETEQGAVPDEEIDAYIIPSERQCKKICRQDIAMLPRCEWRLANNSFLLHGCYNYHHLMLIQESDELWLGIPGIYHSREAKAAEAFGFPRFIPVGELDAELEPDEKEPGEEFGYWSRRVRKMTNFSL